MEPMASTQSITTVTKPLFGMPNGRIFVIGNCVGEVDKIDATAD
jgi:hypothetical protein